MAVEERRRLHLYETARARLGPDAADTLMELLPMVDASELVTKTDLALTTAELRHDMGDLRTELKTEMADLRTELKTEMAELRTELKTEMAELRTELKTEMAELRTDLTVTLHDALREQTNRLVMFVVPTMLTTVGLSFAATHLAA